MIDLRAKYFCVVGFFVFLCLPWVLPSETVYHRLIIILMWVPAFFVLLRYRSGRGVFSDKFWILFCVNSIWFIWSCFYNEGYEATRDVKLPFYVFLFLLGVVFSVEVLGKSLENFFWGCCVLGGLGAYFSWINFYWLEGASLGVRLIGTGLWDVVVPAAHAVGALAVIATFLAVDFSRSRSRWLLFSLMLAVLGYFIFLAFNQTRWVLISVLFSIFLVGSVSGRKEFLIFFIGMAVFVSIGFLFFHDVLLRRGFSYRPEIWASGLAVAKEQWLVGIGMQDYSVYAASLSKSFAHSHNLFIEMFVRFGFVGFIFWLFLWFYVGWQAYQLRNEVLGRSVLALWVYSGCVVLTDGVMPWDKPQTIWFVTWLPVSLVVALGYLKVAGVRWRPHVA